MTETTITLGGNAISAPITLSSSPYVGVSTDKPCKAIDSKNREFWHTHQTEVSKALLAPTATIKFQAGPAGAEITYTVQ